jgi:hypothetical protein
MAMPSTNQIKLYSKRMSYSIKTNIKTILLLEIQRNPVKILKIPRKSSFLSGKFLKRVILMKWENFDAFLS